MFCNSRIVLYLSSLNYQSREFNCASFTNTQNISSEYGNSLVNVTKVFIPLTEMADERILINPNTDYAIINPAGDTPIGKLSVNGELENASVLYKAGAGLISQASLKNYGSKNAQHYYLEVTK